MPNWCHNVLTVCNALDDVDDFVQRNTGADPTYAPPKRDIPRAWAEAADSCALSFNALVPVPSDVLAAGFSDAGYQWQSKHWGTKWGACDVKLIRYGFDGGVAHAVYLFDTAWGPPDQWLARVAPMFPGLAFMLHWFDDEYPHAGGIYVMQDDPEFGRLVTVCRGKGDSEDFDLIPADA